MTGHWWWQRRRHNEPTAEYLGRVLDELGAAELAANARALHYDDYRCPPHIDDGMNIHRLIAELWHWARLHPADGRAQPVITAAENGEFDGTEAEARAWVSSEDGQATLRELGCLPETDHAVSAERELRGGG